MIQHQPLIHGRLVVNIFQLVIVLLHDNRIDGQHPNDLKTQPFISFFFCFFLPLHVYVQGIKRCACLCLFVRQLSFGLSLCVHVLVFSLSLSLSLSCHYAADLVFHFDIYLTAILHTLSCLFVIGLIDFYSLRMLVYVCLSVYILHQFVTVVDRYIK